MLKYDKFAALVFAQNLSCHEILHTFAQDLPNTNVNILAQIFPIIDDLWTVGKYESFFNELAIVCKDKAHVHPEWSLLSGRVKMLHIKRTTPKTFSEATTKLKLILDKDYYNFCQVNSGILDTFVDSSLDWKFDIFAVQTLCGGYLLRAKDELGNNNIVETPQYLYLRVAIFLWRPLQKISAQYPGTITCAEVDTILQSYQYFATGQISGPSPLQFNAGLKKSQVASCFLFALEDSMASITKSWTISAIISANSGGEGISFDALRHSEIGNHGSSKGIVPWIKIQDQILVTVDQGGKRRGSGTMWTCVWHMDVFEFIELKLPIGKEEVRARDLFYGLMIPDLFMNRVERDEMWSLFCPAKTNKLERTFGEEFEKAYLALEHQGLNGKFPRTFRQVPARELWTHIMSCQIKTGMPFIKYKDAANRKSNQQNLGTIRLSNLCVAEDTMILTKLGQFPIKQLADKTVSVWNGQEWSASIVKQTGSNVDLLKIKISGNVTLHCTPEHKFYVYQQPKISYREDPELYLNQYRECRLNSPVVEVRAKDLRPGQFLVSGTLPLATDLDYYKESEPFPSAYTHGFYCGSVFHIHDKMAFTGCGCKIPLETPTIFLQNRQISFVQHLEHTRAEKIKFDAPTYIVKLWLSNKLHPLFTVPQYASVHDKLRWLEGYCDSNGVHQEFQQEPIIKCYSNDGKFMHNVRLMLQTLGVHSFVNKINMLNQDSYSLSIQSLNTLKRLGFSPKRDDINKLVADSFPTTAVFPIVVQSVKPGRKNVDTFCFNEPHKHKGMFNGILAGNCVEIDEYVDEDNIASCNLTSIPVCHFVKGTGKNNKAWFDFDHLGRVTRASLRNLKQMIDRNYYPPEIPEIKYTNFRNRPIGLGIQGLADCFAMMDYCWDSTEAAQLNKEIAACMYYHGTDESIKMAQEFGKYDTFVGSPMSNGFFQFDLWTLEKLCKTESKSFRELINNPIRAFEEINEYRTIHPNERPAQGYDWDTLRVKMVKYGSYFSLLFAQMPTASSAHILGNNESVEPFTQLLFSRTVLSGQFVVSVPTFVNDMQAIGLWNDSTLKHLFANQGSIQTLPSSDLDNKTAERLRYLKRKYKTVFELSQKTLADMYFGRAPYQCQSTSHNMFMKKPDLTRVNAYHFYMWNGGAKTGMYYLRQPAGSEAINFAMDSLSVHQPAKQDTVKDTAEKDDVKDVNDMGVIKNDVVCNMEDGCLVCGS